MEEDRKYGLFSDHSYIAHSISARGCACENHQRSAVDGVQRRAAWTGIPAGLLAGGVLCQDSHESSISAAQPS